MCNKHNGWTNYPTWAVKFWINNSKSEQEMWEEEAFCLLKEALCLLKENKEIINSNNAKWELADLMKKNYDNWTPIQGASMYTDLLEYAFNCVNWYEIADSIIESVNERV